jgi:hypothetical protein
VPDEAVRAKVNEAVRLALSRNLQGRFQFLESVARDDGQGNYCHTQRNVGQAIALVQLRHFGWPDQDGPQFQDIEDAMKVHYAIGAPNRGSDPRQDNNYNATNTEFYMLPELSASARLEVSAGLARPLSRWIIPRLYGSHLGISEVPTPLELFYLADTLGLFVRESLDPGMPMDATSIWTNGNERHENGVSTEAAPGKRHTSGFSTVQLPRGTLAAPVVRWYLLPKPPKLQAQSEAEQPRSLHAFPLVEHALDGDPRDPLGPARPRMILFDAFLVAMGYRGGALDDRHLPMFMTWGGEMLASTWSQPAVYARLRQTREALLRHYFYLRKDPQSAYAEMLGAVSADAARMTDAFGREWQVACDEVLRQGLRRLQQQHSVLQPPARG